MVARLLRLALALWLGRWALRELAAQVARRLPPGPPARESLRQPGLVPGPLDTRAPNG